MDGPQTIIAVVFVALVLVGGALAVNLASKTTAEKHSTNETTTAPALGEIATWPNSTIDGAYYSENATLVNSTGVTLEPGTDYNWFQSNGTAKVLSQAAANESVSAKYDYWTRTERQQQTTKLLAWLFESGAWIPMLLIIALIVLALGMFGGLA